MNYALHKIVDPDRPGFKPDHYSRFKFGDDRVAAAFGRELADGFIRDCLSPSPPTGQLVVVSSPYSFIPTATFALKNYFVFRLNRWLVSRGLPVVEETKIHRTVTYKEDYGELDAAQRMALIGNDRFHIDRAFLQGKIALFLDDIRITGGHERVIQRMIADQQLDNPCYMLYFAELANPAVHPRYENYLNYYHVKSVFDLQDIINSGHFRFNTRVVKFILNTETSAFNIFISQQGDEFVEMLYDMALGNNYHEMEAYAPKLAHIRNIYLKSPHFSPTV